MTRPGTEPQSPNYGKLTDTKYPKTWKVDQLILTAYEPFQSYFMPIG